MNRSLAALALFASLVPAGLRAQEDHGHDDRDGGGVRVDSGWTSPAAGPTSADSLPAFRTDSLKGDIVRGVESGSTILAAPRSARDSADSVTALLRGRRPTISLHGGVNLVDFAAQDDFEASLQSRILRDSLEALQNYETVHIAFPVGVQVLWPVLPWFDAVFRTHSYWYKQTAVLRPRNAEPDAGYNPTEEYFAVQAHLGGAGLRFYIPPDLLSVSGQLGLFVQGVYYWLLGGAELYTKHGSAPAEFDPAGSAWEIQLGFNRVITRPWTISGGLGYMQQHFLSDRPWSAILADNPPPGRAEWGSAALQGFLQFNWHFGVPGQSAKGVPAGPQSGGSAGNSADAGAAAPPAK